jgi:hypothetical protein
LNGLEAQLRLQIKVWGTIKVEKNNPILIMDRWEPVDPAAKVEVWQGSLEVGNIDGKKGFILNSTDGKKYALRNSFSFPEESLQIPPESPGAILTIEGVLQSETMDGLPVILEAMMDTGRAPGDLVPQSTKMNDVMPPPSNLAELISGQVNITRARLVYLSMHFAGGLLPADHPARILQPLWEFSGTLQDGRNVSLFVQAVDEKYLE